MFQIWNSLQIAVYQVWQKQIVCLELLDRFSYYSSDQWDRNNVLDQTMTLLCLAIYFRNTNIFPL